MALLLDTRDVAPEARRDAVRDAYALAELPRQVNLLSQEAVDATRIEGWMFGSLKLFTPESPGLSVIRDSPSGLDPMIALCIQDRGTGRSTEEHRQQLLMPGELLMVDPTARNEFAVSGATIAIEVPFDEIGVTVEVARKASTRLAASPLFPLVSHHLLSLRADADQIALECRSTGRRPRNHSARQSAHHVRRPRRTICPFSAGRRNRPEDLCLCPSTPDRSRSDARHDRPSTQHFGAASLQAVRCRGRPTGGVDHRGAPRGRSQRTHDTRWGFQHRRSRLPQVGIQGPQPLQHQVPKCLRDVTEGTPTAVAASAGGSAMKSPIRRALTAFGFLLGPTSCTHGKACPGRLPE